MYDDDINTTNIQGATNLVICAVRELGVREADLVDHPVVRKIEALEPCVAVDEIEAGAALRADVRNDEVDAVGVATYRSVELGEGRARQLLARKHWEKGARETYRARPDLGVGDKFEGCLCAKT